jgi:hypothetical protein
MAKALAALTLGLCLAIPTIVGAADKKQPDWARLTPEQQTILAPLASDWNSFDDKRRKKWLLTAKRYPKMKPEQQQRLQAQMREWAALTPEQRQTARENYRKLSKQPPDKREVVKEKWRERQRQKRATSRGGTPAPAAAKGDAPGTSPGSAR